MITLDDYRLKLALRRALLRCSWHDVRVCVNPGWHRKEWYYRNGLFLCNICQRLEREVA